MPARFRILLDCTAMRDVSGHRGIGRMLLDLLLGLESSRDLWSQSLEIEALLDIPWRAFPSLCKDLGAAAETLQQARGRGYRTIRWRRGLRLDALARQTRADLVHLPEAMGVPLTSRVPRSVTCHDLIPLRLCAQYLSPISRFTRKPLDLRRFRTAARIVAISDKTRDELIDLLRVPAARIDVVPNGIDLDRWRNEPGPHDPQRLRSLGIRGPFVIYVGGCDPRKDIPALLETVDLVRSRTPLDLVWAGKIPARDLRELRATLGPRGLIPSLDRAILTGFVADGDLALLYRNALAHVFLSRLEGFGLSVAEAMAAGCPVVVTRGSGSDHVAGEAGFVVAPGDARAAADAVHELATSDARRADRVAAGRARCAQFDRKTMASGYVESWLRALHA